MVSRSSSTWRISVAAALLLASSWAAFAQGPASDPAAEVRTLVAGGQLDRASSVVARWMRASPADLDARAWHARLLSWTNKWAEAELEYRDLLARSPDDVDLLAGLADVLTWQGHPGQALPLLEKASGLDRRRADTELRLARVLQQLGRTGDARAAYQEALRRDPGSADAKQGLDHLRESGRHRVVFGSAFDNLNYADNGGAFEASIETGWGNQWTTRGSIAQYSRYGEPATRVAGGATIRFRSGGYWLTAGGAAADDNGIIPRGEVQAEFGRAFTFGPSGAVRGVEATFEPRGQWYRDATVLRLTPGAIVYLPRDWHWLVRASANRVAGSGASRSWKASGWTRLSFPLSRQFGGFVLVGVGTEDSAYLDQILAASSRTLGGGLRIRTAPGRELMFLVQRQAWSGDRAQTSVGVSYGLRY
jgi:YaiO family outer membrane protein